VALLDGAEAVVADTVKTLPDRLTVAQLRKIAEFRL
jgi:hypothetical protein